MTATICLEHLSQGQYREALATLESGLERSPGSLDLHLAAIRLYHELFEPERAAFHLGRARELAGGDRDASNRVRLAEALDHLENRDPRAALRAIESAGEETLAETERLETLLLSSQANLDLGNAFRAFKLAERASTMAAAARQAPAQTRALLILARYQQGKGATARAQEEARHAGEIAMRHGLLELQAEALGLLGQLIPDVDASTRATAMFRGIAATLGAERGERYLTRPHRLALLAPGAAPAPAARRDSMAAPGSTLVATLSEITSLINSMSDIDSLLEQVMDMAISIVGAERGLILLTRGEEIEVKVARNIEGETIPGMHDFSARVVREVARGREVVAFDTNDDVALRQHESVSLYSIRSLVCFPLRVQDRVLGAVYLDNQRQVRAYPQEDLEFLRAFTNLAAIALENARLLGQLKEENVHLRRVARERFQNANIIGSGPAMARVFRLVEKAMEAGFPVLVTGETGTGKEIITKAIHYGSARKDKPLVVQNCAAIPSELLESEMFGYRRGAFTGADQDKKGLFEIANGGTLFLDEIGELDMQLQAKLLRVLQEGLIRRVGETAERRVDVRIIAATNRDLRTAVDVGTFRLDLFYRLNVLQIELPPLRERIEDLPELARFFLGRACKQMNKSIRGFTVRAMERMGRYRWPGNVRELENVIARAVVFADGELIDVDSLPPFLGEGAPAMASPAAVTGPTATPPAGDESSLQQRAQSIFSEVEQGKSFWDAVKKPFLKRDISREVVREVLRMGLERSGWKYTRALATFHLPDEEYRRFMNFLAKFNLKVDRPSAR